MARSQHRSNRKVSGKKYVAYRKKKLRELGRNSAMTLPGDKKVKEKRGMGGNIKRALLRCDEIIVNNAGKCEKLKIEDVEDNPANIHYTRRSIITKGGIVRTQKGKVRVTSRPGQNGALYGVFIE